MHVPQRKKKPWKEYIAKVAKKLLLLLNKKSHEFNVAKTRKSNFSRNLKSRTGRNIFVWFHGKK